MKCGWETEGVTFTVVADGISGRVREDDIKLNCDGQVAGCEDMHIV
jgi:hypothetical protein